MSSLMDGNPVPAHSTFLPAHRQPYHLSCKAKIQKNLVRKNVIDLPRKLSAWLACAAMKIGLLWATTSTLQDCWEELSRDV